MRTESFAAVVDAEHERTLRLACLLAGDRDLAEDATAEAFARTYEQWVAGRITDVGPYLRRAVVNQVKNQRRSLARLAAYISACAVRTVEVTNRYRHSEFREDLRGIYLEAGGTWA